MGRRPSAPGTVDRQEGPIYRAPPLFVCSRSGRSRPPTPPSQLPRTSGCPTTRRRIWERDPSDDDARAAPAAQGQALSRPHGARCDSGELRRHPAQSDSGGAPRGRSNRRASGLGKVWPFESTMPGVARNVLETRPTTCVCGIRVSKNRPFAGAERPSWPELVPLRHRRRVRPGAANPCGMGHVEDCLGPRPARGGLPRGHEEASRSSRA